MKNLALKSLLSRRAMLSAVALVVALVYPAFCQTPVLFKTAKFPCDLKVDGEFVGSISATGALRAVVPEGEHILDCGGMFLLGETKIPYARTFQFIVQGPAQRIITIEYPSFPLEEFLRAVRASGSIRAEVYDSQGGNVNFCSGADFEGCELELDALPGGSEVIVFPQTGRTKQGHLKFRVSANGRIGWLFFLDFRIRSTEGGMFKVASP